MILVADSGSTKCDWMILDGEKAVLEFSTMGFNPYFHNSQLIEATLRKEAGLRKFAAQIEFIFFYGAGCSSLELKGIVKQGLQTVFPNAEINVGHDLDAAALATFQGQPHIACILGTGSNSCFFDGKDIHEEVPALAYILGDEGSGSFLGKRLLADFFYKRMPSELAVDFQTQFGIDMNVMVEKVYVRPHANVYLASLARFCSPHKESPYIQEIVREGLWKFLDVHVTCYPNYQDFTVNFVGSIAFYFEAELREIAAEMGITIGKIVKKPIQALVDYHMKYTFSKVG